MRRTSLRERPSNFNITSGDHWAKQGLVFAGLGRTTRTTRYHDSSAYRNHATLTNMDPTTDWVWDSTLNRFATSFDGELSQYATTGKVFTGSPVSAAFWVYFIEGWIPGLSGYYGSIFAGLFGSVTVLVKDTLLTLYNPNLFIDISSIANQWVHFGLYHNGSHYWLYRNGALISDDDHSPSPSTLILKIGGDPVPGSQYFLEGNVTDCIISYSDLRPLFGELADPSNVMLSGLLVPPKRKYYALRVTKKYYRIDKSIFSPSWIK